jgi:RNA polymerase sigma factor (sigma-70 family)
MLTEIDTDRNEVLKASEIINPSNQMTPVVENPNTARLSFMETLTLARDTAEYRAKRVLARKGLNTTQLGRVAVEKAFSQRLAASLTPQEHIQIPAYDALVKSNLLLVNHFARRFHVDGIPLGELISEGTDALMRAIDKYEPEREIKLSVYAKTWIDQALARFSKKYLDFNRNTRYLSESTNREGTRFVGDNISYEDEPTVEDRAITNVLIESLHEKLGTLEPRVIGFLNDRFGLDGSPGMSLRELGRKLGKTAPTIQKLERDTLALMRSLMGLEQTPI